MKKLKTVTFIMFLCIVLCGCGLFYPLEANPLNIKPEFDGGKGTVEDPYLISTPKQFYEIRWKNRANYKLTKDIDFNDFSYQQEKEGDLVPGYKPIAMFMGSIDGDGYTIRNFYFHDHNYNRMGLFGIIKNATIKNLGIQGFNYTQTESILKNQFTKDSNENFFGFLAGESIDSTISSCKFEYASNEINLISTKNTAFGGVVGVNRGTISDIFLTGMMQTRASEGTVDDYFNFKTGNVSGINYGDISYCFISSSILLFNDLSTNGYLGGVTGYNYGEIKYINLKGMFNATNLKVSESVHVGGLVGYADKDSTISDCFLYNLSLVAYDKNYYVGGLIGTQHEESGVITNCAVNFLDFFSMNDVKMIDKKCGFIAGVGYHESYQNVYYFSSNTGIKVFGNSDQDLTEFHISDIFDQNTFENWDFPNTWMMSVLPILRFNERIWIYSDPHDYFLRAFIK